MSDKIVFKRFKLPSKSGSEKVNIVTISFEHILRIFAIYDYAKKKGWPAESALRLSSLKTFQDYQLTCVVINEYLSCWVFQTSYLEEGNKGVKFFFYGPEEVESCRCDFVQRKIMEGESEYNEEYDEEAFKTMADNLNEEDIEDIICEQKIQKSVSSHRISKENYEKLMAETKPGFVSKESLIIFEIHFQKGLLRFKKS